MRQYEERIIIYLKGKKLNTVIHFIDVGQGNMVLIEATDEKYYICDCNVTSNNDSLVLSYIASVIGVGTPITAFINTHRDADHIRGIKKIHEHFPIKNIWESGHPGTTTDSHEYTDYMDLRRKVGSQEKKRKTRKDLGMTRLRYLSSKDERLEKNANAQGLVMKIEHWNSNSIGSSVILPGDCDAETWRYAIMDDYSKADLKASILMAAHHGSISFFDDPHDTENYYTGHIKTIAPGITVVSVGDNQHGHPDKKAIELYEKYTSGSKQGNKILTTQKKGNMKLTLKNDGWSLSAV